MDVFKYNYPSISKPCFEFVNRGSNVCREIL